MNCEQITESVIMAEAIAGVPQGSHLSPILPFVCEWCDENALKGISR